MLENPHAKVRLRAAEVLQQRGDLKVTDAEGLLRDPRVATRRLALRALIKSGRKFTKDEVTQIFKKAAERPRLTEILLSLPRESDEAKQAVEREYLASLSDAELSQMERDDVVANEDAIMLLNERDFGSRSAALRLAVDDRYKAQFDGELERLSAVLNAESVERWRDLETFIRQERTRRALTILCERFEEVDLARVRSVLTSGFVRKTPADVEYLGRCGAWSDILLVLSALKSPEYDVPAGLMDRAAARAIVRLAGKRLADATALVHAEAGSETLIQLVAEIPEAEFEHLSDENVGALLDSEIIAVRRVAAIKCVRVWSRDHLERFLDGYLTRDRYYYNVVYWMDFGASVQRDQGRDVATRLLELVKLGS